ncbi:domains rearranged methyltransferase 2 [Prunus dulcis]|uniref:Domains rearranged methyltransferase 2 n=1 Tax=Prunus dulcis TaxID=3755 RepID=A0A4Y1RYT9_PRUDU|nr:domains rearranged methyltransferase 2 [Prunus dulcis]
MTLISSPVSPFKGRMIGALFGFTVQSHGKANFRGAWKPLRAPYIAHREMDGNTSGEDGNDIDWSTEDELEIESFTLSSSSSLTVPGREAIVGSGEASSSQGPSNSKVVDHFVGMGFSGKMVAKAIEEHGEENTDSILETLLTYSALESSPQEQQQVDCDDQFSSDSKASFLDDFSDIDSYSDNEDILNPTSEKNKKLLSLVNMGYTVEEASIAIERCGLDSTVVELTDFICAAQMARAEDAHLPLEEKPRLNHAYKKRKLLEYELLKKKKLMRLGNKTIDEDDEAVHLPNPMVGFGIPSEPCLKTHRNLPEAALGPPYFYYENVAFTPKGVWSTISRFLYDVQPEFVDSKYFCAAARKRGYVHNLPIENRFPLIPLPPHTIHEAFPLIRKWWPSWDTRTKLNCLLTSIASAKSTERIRKALEDYDGEPPLRVQKYVLDECRKWNLVWVGRNKVAPLEPDEVEMLLGFPKNHTRGISRTDRYKSLGNSFQIDTVAYHLSVLKDMFPNGINLLSLFSGIGGAEIALHRLGIRLKNVVSVEISAVNRNVVRSWWEQTNQRGNLYDLDDVQQLNGDRLEHYMTYLVVLILWLVGVHATILQAATGFIEMDSRVKNLPSFITTIVY